MKYPFCQFKSAVLAVSPPKICSPPACSLGKGSVRNRMPQYCASAIQQQLKHWCVIDTVLITDLNSALHGLLLRKVAPPQPVEWPKPMAQSKGAQF